MASKAAAYYDLVYSAKDYAAESAKLHTLIQQHKRSPGTALLDVACGTGGHLAYLQQHYVAEGLDNDSDMLAIARQRCPNVPLHLADMVTFDLSRRFDVVVCLFSAIGYTRTVERMTQAVRTMARHVSPGGLLIVEPWMMPQFYQPGGIDARIVDEPEFKFIRMARSTVEGTISTLHFDYLVGTPSGVEQFSERHELGLFTHEEYLSAFQSCGLDVTHDWLGLIRRGLFIGRQP
jgi:ubiquinone/menaquinone biosynthesis C-methylase UbiE